MCVCMCVFKRDISISPPYDVWIFFTDEYCSGVNIFQGWTFFNSNLEFAQITLVLLYAILCKNTIGLRKLSKKIVQRSDLANKTKTTTNVNQPNPTNTLPIRIQTYINKMPISSTILWQDKISMSRAWQQFTNTGQIHQSDVNMTDTIPFPCHLSTTGTEKLSIIDRSANPPPIHIQSQYRPMQVSNVRIHWTHWPLALAGIGAGLVVDCQINSKVLIPLTKLIWPPNPTP